MHLVKLFLLSCLIAGTGIFTSLSFEKKGISFSLEENWKIIEEIEIDTVGYSIILEEDEIGASGTVIISWFQDSTNLYEILDDYVSSMKQNPDFIYGDVSFEEIKVDTYGKYAGLSSTYRVRIDQEMYLGHVYVFHGYRKTLTIHTHGSETDFTSNQKGFSQLRASLRCEGTF